MRLMFEDLLMLLLYVMMMKKLELTNDACDSLMFEKLQTADVTLACDDDEWIKAHKCIQLITNNISFSGLFHKN